MGEVNRVFTEEACASIVDLTMTQVVDQDLVKMMSWYDNEWGCANQMIREALQLPGPDSESSELR